MAKVCLDAGHYGNYNRCPNNANFYESNIVWKLTNLQKKYLEQLGVSVVLTRDNKDVDLALVDRGKKSQGCDLFISNHTNAVGSTMNDTVDYALVIHLTDDVNVSCDDKSKLFADKIAPVVASTMGLKQGAKIQSKLENYDRNGDGILNDNYYGVLHGARVVGTAGVIIEHSFHTNTNVVNWLLNDNNLDKLARAEAECIASFVLGKTVTLNGANNTTTSGTSNNKQTLYCVQVGAYSVKANADNMLNKLKSAGFTGYITTKEK